MPGTITGLEVLLADPPAWAGKAKIGLLSHPPAVDRRFIPSAELLGRLLGPRLRALFGPQHGFWGDKQDNMIESADADHPLTGLRVYSLYGAVRRPTPEMLEGLEVILVDLQDVGTRVYTFIQTLKLVMEACARAGIKVVVLDRPNPLGRAVEGNLLEPDCRSFVGLFELPMRHGLTVGEAARLLIHRGLDCDLEVVPMRGYDPLAGWEGTGLPWVMPSPNMPALETAKVYPGQVLWEGTKLSEGRGTTRPFEIWGAPFIRPHRLAARMADYDLPGVVLRPIFFEPTFHKHAGETCGGLFVHVTDRQAFRPYRTSLALLQAVAGLWPEEFAFREPPYEYETLRRPMDLILGRRNLADQVIQGRDLDELESGWAVGLERFKEEAGQCRIY